VTAPAPEVVKYYTRARKFPQLIGRTPDGAKIWGGPYTFTQAISAGVVLFVGVNTMGLWAHHGLIGNALILLGLAYGVVLVLGRIPPGARNPLAVLAGVVHALAAPRTGRVAGRAVRVRRPHRVRHRITVLRPPVPEPPAPVAVAGAPARRAKPAPVPVRTRRPTPAASPLPKAVVPAPRQPALSGVQALLARSGSAPAVRT
jgi:hypothetical protein